MFLRGMSNVLADDKHQQIVALGRLGCSLRRMERATGVRRDTISSYLKAAGIVVPGRGRRPAVRAKPAFPAMPVSTGDGGEPRPVVEASGLMMARRKRPQRWRLVHGTDSRLLLISSRTTSSAGRCSSMRL